MGKWKGVWGTGFKRMGGDGKRKQTEEVFMQMWYMVAKWNGMQVWEWLSGKEMERGRKTWMWSHSAELDASYMSQWKVNGQERNTGIRTGSFCSAKQLNKWQVLKGRERAKIFIRPIILKMINYVKNIYLFTMNLCNLIYCHLLRKGQNPGTGKNQCLSGLFKQIWRFSTAWYGTVRFSTVHFWGVLHWVQSLVPGTFFSTTSVEVPREPYHYQNVTCKLCWSLIGRRESSLSASLNLQHDTTVDCKKTWT